MMQTADEKQVGAVRPTTDCIKPYAEGPLPLNSFNGETGKTVNKEQRLPNALYQDTADQKESFLPEDTGEEEPKAENEIYRPGSPSEQNSTCSRADVAQTGASASEQAEDGGRRVDDNNDKEDPDSHLSNNDGPDNHVSNNDDPDNHPSNNDGPNNHVSNNDDPDNHVYYIDDPDNLPPNNDHPGTSHSEPTCGQTPKVKAVWLSQECENFPRGVPLAQGCEGLFDSTVWEGKQDVYYV
ncbi:hypothetical protein Bbelb_361740 [Branchiostoma belcheri]|nr:hypothetical protein Bbelb_361740 [Branchiostoma belcheri]